MTCPPDKEYDAGLCYKSCRAGYKGAGPVCWGQAPRGWVECGMGAAANELVCAMTTGSQVMSVAQMTQFAVSLGTSSSSAPAEAPVKIARLIAKLKAQFRKIKPVIKKLQEFLDSDAIKGIDLTTWLAEVAETLAVEQENGDITAADVTRIIASLTDIFDPTGISAAVSSYTHDICSY